MNAKRRQVITGLVLIVLGVVFLLTQYLELGPGLFLALLGSIFLFAHAFTLSYGVLIPVCLIAGLGRRSTFERVVMCGAKGGSRLGG